MKRVMIMNQLLKWYLRECKTALRRCFYILVYRCVEERGVNVVYYMHHYDRYKKKQDHFDLRPFVGCCG